MKKTIIRTSLLSILALGFFSCSDDDDGVTTPSVVAPNTFVFERNGETSISFTGQTNRILMAEELIDALVVPTNTEAQLDAMFTNPDGEDPFADAALNTATQNIRSKTAASFDFFNANATDATAIKAEFESWIKEQVDEVFPAWTTDASAGNPGRIERTGSNAGSYRYVNANGLELNQVVNKSLIGALMTDQMLNNYISSNVLDPFQVANDAETLVTDKNYTDMEHDWDEAYGYLFGTASDVANPLVDIGEGLGGSDSFLNKYLDRVNDDPDFNTIAQEIYDALKLGRAAIVAKDYTVRNQQAEIIREKVSEVIGVRAVYYLQSGKTALEEGVVDYAAAFHDLSEAYGFVYSLQFTRRPNSTQPYFTRAQVQDMLEDLVPANNGLWTVTPEALQTLSETIATQFSFTVAQAADPAN